MEIIYVGKATVKPKLKVFETLVEQGFRVLCIRCWDWWATESKLVSMIKSRSNGFKIPFLKDDYLIHFDPSIVKYLSKSKNQIVFGNGYGSLTSLYLFICARIRRIPVIIWLEGSGVLFKSRSLPIRIAQKFANQFINQFAVSSHQLEEKLKAENIKSERIFYLPYPCETERFNWTVDEKMQIRFMVRRELGIPIDSKVILSVARLENVKNINFTIDVVKLLRQNADAYLLLAGDGSLRSELIKKIDEENLFYVKLLGPVPSHEIFKYYAASDVFVLASKSETWGAVIGEAKCAGLPIVSNYRIPAAAEYVKNGYNGLLLENDNIQTWAQALEDIMSQASLSANAQAAAEPFKNELSISNVGKILSFRLKQSISNRDK